MGRCRGVTPLPGSAFTTLAVSTVPIRFNGPRNVLAKADDLQRPPTSISLLSKNRHSRDVASRATDDGESLGGLGVGRQGRRRKYGGLS